jgi:hypothetical protein
MYEKLDAKMFEIKRQMRQPNGYPFDPHDLESSLQLLIEGKFPPRIFAAWKRVRLGNGLKTVADFKKAIGNNKYSWPTIIEDGAIDLMNSSSFKVNDKPIGVELVMKSVRELNFPKGAKYSEICHKGMQIGLKLCSAEVGPQLRVQYTDQEIGFFYIAMDPIEINNQKYIFYLENDSLDVTNGSPSNTFDASAKFVFVKNNIIML